MTTEAPWAGRDILDRLRGATFDTVTAEDLADAVAEIERLRATPEQIARAIWEDEQRCSAAIASNPTDLHLNGRLMGLQRARDIARKGGERRMGTVDLYAVRRMVHDLARGEITRERALELVAEYAEGRAERERDRIDEAVQAERERIAQAIEAHAEGYGDPADNAYEYVKIARSGSAS